MTVFGIFFLTVCQQDGGVSFIFGFLFVTHALLIAGRP